MSSTKGKLLAMTVALAALSAPSGMAAAVGAEPNPKYTITDLGTFGATSAFAQDMNANGEVLVLVERATDPAATPTADGATTLGALLWSNGSATDLGTLGGPVTDAYDLNNAGQVVGSSTTADGKTRAFRWADGEMTDLGTLGGSHSEAIRTNEVGQVVGFSTTEPGQELGDAGTHAFLWEDGKMIDLGTFGGGFSRANGINNAGQVVGAAQTTDGTIHAFRWQDGVMADLGTLPGYDDSRALRISDNGLVVGIAGSPVDGKGKPSVTAIAFVDGETIDIGTLPGFPASSVAQGVNDAGLVVGSSYLEDAPEGAVTEHAFVWHDGVLSDLNDLVEGDSTIEITSVLPIEADGRIAGGGLVDGIGHAIVLTPMS